MNIRSTLTLLIASSWMATAAHAQEPPIPEGDPIVVTADRLNDCESDWWCTSVSADDFGAHFDQPEINPFGDLVGDGGGGNQIVVTADRESDEEDECEEQANNNAFLGNGNVPTEPVIVLGEVHDNQSAANDPDEVTNRERQEDLIDRAGSDGSNVCVAVEFAQGASPNSSQESLYDYANANNIPVFNMDPSQTGGPGSTDCELDFVFDEDISNCFNSRDSTMASNILSALAIGVDGTPCERVVAVVGDAHSSQMISNDYLFGIPALRTTLIDHLLARGIDPFVTNPQMHEEECQE